MVCEKVICMNRKPLLGMCIGDGHITSKGSLRIRHSDKQREYAFAKAQRISEIIGRGEINVSPYNYNGFPCWQFSVGNQYFRIVRKWLYPNNTKIISRNYLDKLNDEAIAYWYMDDGSLSAKRRKGLIHSHELTISTCCSLEEVITIIDYFKEKWGVKFSKRKMKNHFSIRCGKQEAMKFIEIVKPFIIESMKYKITFSTNAL